MVVTLLPMVTEVMEVHQPNAQSPMIVTLFGMATEVRAVNFKNAFTPIATVGYPPNIDGMSIAPPTPLYPKMVALPSFTENL
jgi:hypothetical protein